MIRGLVANMSSNMTQLLVYVVVTFVMAPLYLKMLGPHDYGLREMILALIGYMGMLDLGMRPTVSRYVAMHNARGERESLLVVYATSQVFMCTLGTVFAVVFWGWALINPQILLPEEGGNVDKYVQFLFLVGAGLIFSFPRSVVESYLEGLQRYYFKNIVNSLATILLAVLSYYFMTPDNALVLFAFLVAVFALTRLVIFIYLLRGAALGVHHLDLRLFSMKKLKEMLGFGVKSFIQGAAQTVEKTSDRLVIGFILGPASVPVYTIPYTLVSNINDITTTLTHVFMPLFSDLSPRGEHEKIRKIYLFSSKLVVGLVVLPMAVGINLIGGPFIQIWMNGAFDQSTVEAIIFFMSIYIAVPRLNPFVSRYLTAINQHGIIARLAPFAALANLLLSILLVIKIGPVGAALGSIFPVCITTPIYLRHACRYLGITVRAYVVKCILPALIPLGLMVGVVLWFRLTHGLETYQDIILAILLGASIYSSVFWLLSLDKPERNWLSKVFLNNRNGNLSRK
jgi:O-antigen/teichoic acid export membrane protein